MLLLVAQLDNGLEEHKSNMQHLNSCMLTELLYTVAFKIVMVELCLQTGNMTMLFL